jgi:hypothetical protein
MTVVESLTLDDRSLTAPPVVPPGEVITKTWRIENSGTCAWNDGYYAVFGSGNVPAAEMGGQPVSIAGTVVPGAKYNISAGLVAPLDPGIYQAMWELRNGDDQSFGERLALALQVPARPTTTPVPTQTPVPDVMLTVYVADADPDVAPIVTTTISAAGGLYAVHLDPGAYDIYAPGDTDGDGIERIAQGLVVVSQQLTIEDLKLLTSPPAP